MLSLKSMYVLHARAESQLGAGGIKAKSKHSLGYCKQNTCALVQRSLALCTHSPLNDTHKHACVRWNLERATGREEAVRTVCGEKTHTPHGVSERLTRPTAYKPSVNQNYVEQHTYARIGCMERFACCKYCS